MQLNTVVLNGNIVADAEVKEFQNSAVVKFRLAFHQGRGDKETSGFIDVKKWGDKVGALAPHLVKGKAIAVEGRLEMESWEKDGTKHQKFVIVANNVQFVPQGEKKQSNDTSNDTEEDDSPPF